MSILSLAGAAKPRSLFTADYHEKDEFNVADFIERMRCKKLLRLIGE